jgi:hypothetical protein
VTVGRAQGWSACAFSLPPSLLQAIYKPVEGIQQALHDSTSERVRRFQHRTVATFA